MTTSTAERSGAKALDAISHVLADLGSNEMSDSYDPHAVQVEEMFGVQDRWETERLARYRVQVNWIGDVEELIRGLRIAAEGMVDPTIDIEDRQEYDGLPILYVDGYKPGGDAARAEWERQQEVDRSYRRAQYDRLRAEFEGGQ